MVLKFFNKFSKIFNKFSNQYPYTKYIFPRDPLIFKNILWLKVGMSLGGFMAIHIATDHRKHKLIKYGLLGEAVGGACVAYYMGFHYFGPSYLPYMVTPLAMCILFTTIYAHFIGKHREKKIAEKNS
ncbi:MAG: hypothetical protein Satyrvirus7_3 [Satyrvirus sp.]|uniref:Uncharacterized protein n=1 Tax=Satyrvirus sp. TaxID=2487771 RepID=A0A3G5AIH0_9VIRU|nr:MAG: hypothetical protein Satyrvirus7_3 [Satyrvirus sp.]